MVEAAHTRDSLTVVDDQLGSPTSAFDLADGILSIAHAWQVEPAQGRGEIYHLAGPEQLSWCAFASAIMDECRRLGLPAADVQPIPAADWPTTAIRPRNSALDSGKFARDFGIAMPDLRASLGTAVQRLASQT